MLISSKSTSTIKAEMVRHDLGVVEVAEDLDISASSLYNKINGKTPWMLHEAKKLVDLFNSKENRYTLDNIFFL